MADKPKLVLAGGRPLTAEHIAKMFKTLTGRDVSPEDMKYAEEKLAAAYASQRH